jgi:photosystem II stability/assembly factor-like uncharacterized protein
MWTVLEMMDARFRSICFPENSEEGWALGTDGMVWPNGRPIHYVDGEWKPDQNLDPAYENYAYSALHFTDNTHGWMVGDVILCTTNGTEWVFQTFPPSHLNDVFFLNAQEGWAVGYGAILHTTDGGTNWLTEAADLTAGKDLRAVYAANPEPVYVVGENTVLKYSPSTVEPTSPRLAIDRELILTLSGEPGQAYVVQTSSNLSAWADWTNVVCTNGAVQVRDPAVQNNPHRFYRARTP